MRVSHIVWLEACEHILDQESFCHLVCTKVCLHTCIAVDVGVIPTTVESLLRRAKSSFGDPTEYWSNIASLAAHRDISDLCVESMFVTEYLRIACSVIVVTLYLGTKVESP